MSEAITLTLAALAGALLGSAFFGGLWWTIRRALLSPRPAVWFIASLLVRMAVVLVGFYGVTRGDWRRLASCLGGFLLARGVLTRLARDSGVQERRTAQGGAP